MKKRFASVLIILLVTASFFAGAWFNQSRGRNHPETSGPKVLYWVDPMNPLYKSDKPGVSPNCGMALEPVYADGGSSRNRSEEMAGMPAGTVRIGGEWQQLFGVKVGAVEKKAISHTIRILGRVAVDETRIYRIDTTISGWITRTFSNASGSRVRKNETLAAFYSPEFLSAGQALINALNSIDRVQAPTTENPAQTAQIAQYKINLQQYKDSLKNLGMGDLQIEEMIRTRQFIQNVNITSPADGFILARNVSEGQRFEKGTELYRIADLKHIWVLADIFENEAQFLKPGVVVRVLLLHQNATFRAIVSNTLPQFDPVSRTLKVRLEVDNPDFVLKPDMFVDVEFPISYPPAVTAPIDAIIDSGLRNTVFVDLGNGFFEPRKVETGWRSGDRIEIVKGLSPGERIVVSGSFLIDSESRMKAALSGIEQLSIDPFCGHSVNMNKARAAGKTSAYRGKTYYFCSDECKEAFEKDPDQALSSPAPGPAPAAPDDGSRHD